MKTIIKTLTVILAFFFSITACQKSPAPLTESEKEEIKKEIRQLWDYSGDGITERNADKTFSMFSSNEGVKYIRDGHLYGSIDEARNQYAEWFKNPNSVKRKISSDPVIFDILDKNTVLMTAIGKLEVVDDTTGQKPWVITYTLLWRKEPEGWKVFNVHNLWE
ncbi:MAG TPA: nuclear transport factor 2 family protein [Draconibacterium sp.]|nr:nuclear transport factor 2 family protein [Draconibacterium sp.]